MKLAPKLPMTPEVLTYISERRRLRDEAIRLIRRKIADDALRNAMIFAGVSHQITDVISKISDVDVILYEEFVTNEWQNFAGHMKTLFKVGSIFDRF